MSAAPSSPYPRLRPLPHPPMPYGPFRPGSAPGRIVQFPTYGDRVIAWIEKHCVFTARRWARKPFILTPWQKQLIVDLFEIDAATELRRYRWALIGMPRKNGKTELMAALALWFLLGEVSEDTPVIVVAATSDRQANLIFSAAVRMAKYSPTLTHLVDPRAGELRVKARPEAKIVRVSAKARAAHGLNISHLVLDELHEWPQGAGDELWDVLTTGMGASIDPLVLQITTAGYDLDNTVCGREYQHGRRIESGEERDRAYFFRWWQAPDGCALDDVEAIRIGNPAYGVIKARTWFDDMRRRLRPALFRRLELNQWTALANAWLPEGAWEACRLLPGPMPEASARLLRLMQIRVAAAPTDDDVLFEAMIVEEAIARGLRPDLPMYVGWDASAKVDSTALTAAQEQDTPAGRRIRLAAWIWEREWDQERHRPSENWIMPMDEVAAAMVALNRWFDVRAFPFDANLVRWEALKLYDAGLPMLEVRQAGAQMEQASQAFYEAVVQRVAAHDGEAKLGRHVASAAARQSRNGAGAWRLAKAEAVRKMDAAVAAAMAIYALQHPEPEEPAPAPVIAKVYGDDDGDAVERI